MSSWQMNNHRIYNGFGKLTSETNSSVNMLFGFTGKPLDKDSGLQNNFQRWYDTAIGQWLNEDPIGFNASDSNLRRYVGGSSVNYIDPDGLEAISSGAENIAQAGSRASAESMQRAILSAPAVGQGLGGIVQDPNWFQEGSYGYFLTHPWEMDRDLAIGFGISTAAAAGAGLLLGGIAAAPACVAGAGGTIIVGG